MSIVRRLYGDHCYVQEPEEDVYANSTLGRGKDFSNMTLVLSKGNTNKVAASNITDRKTKRSISSSVNVQNKVICYRKKKSFGKDDSQTWTRTIMKPPSSVIVPFHLAMPSHHKGKNRIRTIADSNSTVIDSELAFASHANSRNRIRAIADSASTDIVLSSKAPSTYKHPLEFCTKHSDMILLEDENLIKPGDKFETHDHLVQYLNENAKRWHFYYSCRDSKQLKSGYATYTYRCVFLESKHKAHKTSEMRNREEFKKTNCPCTIKFRRLLTEKELTAVYVCNHHDHELTQEQFNKLQHGRRLSPQIKEEIKDFLRLEVGKKKIAEYVQMETGLNITQKFLYDFEKKLQNANNIDTPISLKRMRFLNKKLAAVDDWRSSNNDISSEFQFQSIENIFSDDDISIKDEETVDRLHISDNEDISNENEENMDNLCMSNVEMPSENKCAGNLDTSNLDILNENEGTVADLCAGDNIEYLDENEETVDDLCLGDKIEYLDENEEIVNNWYANGSIEISPNIKTRRAKPNQHYLKLCTEHSDMFLLEDDNLVKPGDKFESHNHLLQYLNKNAKRWLFYYKCDHSNHLNTKYETYIYRCVFFGKKSKIKEYQRLRRRQTGLKTDCPCTIKVKRLPNEKVLTATYVCNHHDHELSLKQFYKLQHGRRLPPYVKEEIIDFLSLKVEIQKIRQYVKMETGFFMTTKFFRNMRQKLRTIPPKKITEQRRTILNKKIAELEDLYTRDKSISSESEEWLDDLCLSDNSDVPSVKAPEKSDLIHIIEISSEDEENVENMCPVNTIPSQNEKFANENETKVYVHRRTKVYMGQNKSIVNNSGATNNVQRAIPSQNAIFVDNQYATNDITDVVDDDPSQNEILANENETKVYVHRRTKVYMGQNKSIVDNQYATNDITDVDDDDDPSQNEIPVNNLCTTNKITIQKKTEEPVTREYPIELEYCNTHSDMFLLEDEYLVKPGDKFESHHHLVEYLNENAKRWNFYYKCDCSSNLNTKYESYTYKCLFSRNKYKTRTRGIRKRKNLEKTNCPCTIKFKHQPNEKELTAVYVCNHHNHELSREQFYKLQHGRRLPSHIKEDINDLLLLQVDKSKIRKYVQMETGIYMRLHFFTFIKKKLENARQTASHISVDRLKMLTGKILALEKFDIRNKGDTSKQSKEALDKFDIRNKGTSKQSKKALDKFDIRNKGTSKQSKKEDHHITTESAMEQRWLELNKVMDKDIQTSDVPSDTDVEDSEESEFVRDSQNQTDIMNIKHEYVHKYNLDQYMTQSNFPKYLEILSKEQGWNILDMLANVYNEKAMLKLSSIQKESEVVTEIRYILPDGETSPNNNNLYKKRKTETKPSLFILKEKWRLLKDYRELLLNENAHLKEMSVSVTNNTVQE